MNDDTRGVDDGPQGRLEHASQTGLECGFDQLGGFRARGGTIPGVGAGVRPQALPQDVGLIPQRLDDGRVAVLLQQTPDALALPQLFDGWNDPDVVGHLIPP